eukprot:m.53658 g.53658  ORF g.53658 m.53658 type:complete len:289 (+) comp21795_c1_seq1:333-1199(+)
MSMLLQSQPEFEQAVQRTERSPDCTELTISGFSELLDSDLYSTLSNASHHDEHHDHHLFGDDGDANHDEFVDFGDTEHEHLTNALGLTVSTPAHSNDEEEDEDDSMLHSDFHPELLFDVINNITVEEPDVASATSASLDHSSTMVENTDDTNDMRIDEILNRAIEESSDFSSSTMTPQRSVIDRNLALLGKELHAPKIKTRRPKKEVKRKDDRYKRYREENNKAAAANRALKREEKSVAKKRFVSAKDKNKKLLAMVANLEYQLATLSKKKLFPRTIMLSEPPSLLGF